MTIRAIEARDADAARALVAHQFGGTRYESRMRELLHEALESGGDESGLVSHDGGLRGLLLYSEIAGANSVARISCVLGSIVGCSSLVEHILARSYRITFAEFPSDEAFQQAAQILKEHGFSLESRVPDFSGEGVDLRIMVRRGT